MHSVSEFQNRVEPKLDTKQYILCDAIYVKSNRQNESAVTGAEQSFLAWWGGITRKGALRPFPCAECDVGHVGVCHNASSCTCKVFVFHFL